MGFPTDLAKTFLLSHGGPSLRGRVLPLKLTLGVTYVCNHRCKLCGVWKIYQEDSSKRKLELTKEDYERVFEDLSQTLIYLDITGGEPFARRDVVDVLLSANRICPRLNTITTTTNGLQTARIAKAVESLTTSAPDCSFSIGVSLDGDREYHDRMRGLQGTYDSALATIAAIRDLMDSRDNLDVKISYTIGRQSAGRFEAFYNDVVATQGLGISHVTFNVEHAGLLYQTADSGPQDHWPQDSQDAIQRDVSFILGKYRSEKLDASRRMRSFYRRYFVENIPSHFADPTRMIAPCKAAQNSFFVDPYGDVFPCIIWDRRLGNVRDGIREIIENSTTKATVKSIQCAKCPVCWNACEVIPSLLTSARLPTLVAGAVIR